MELLVQEEKVNLKRQKEFDVIKALAILFMIVIHTYEELYYADTTYICSNFFDISIEFLGGPLAAPVFMFAMGLGMSYSKHRSPKELLLRGIKLVIFSYIFNILRFTIPLFVSGGAGDETTYLAVYLTFHVDILTFAGYAFIFTALFKKLKVPVLVMLGISILMQLVGIILTSNITFTNSFVILLLAPFIKTDFISYFPLFQWYIYPVLGIVYAKYLRHIENTDKLYGLLLLISSCLLASLCVSLNYVGYDLRQFFTLTNEYYYDQTLLHVLFTMSCVLVELSIVHFIMKFVHIKWLENLIAFLSNNLNKIYITQWIIIGWTSYFIFYEEGMFAKWLIIPVGILIMTISSLIVLLLKKISIKRKEKKKC